MWNRIKGKLQERKGSSVIEYAMALMLFVIVTAFFVDILTIGGKQFRIAQEATDTARVIGVQGGISPAVPAGYPGGDRAYMTSLELVKKLNERMEKSGIDQESWKAVLTEYDESGQAIRQVQVNPRTDFKVDYMHSMDLHVEASYQWNLMRIVTAGVLDEVGVGATRHTISEFKYDFDEWEGESY